MKTGLITSNTYKNHNTGDGHPEKIDRVTAVIENFKKIDNKNLIWKKPNDYDQSILSKTHSSNYIDQVQNSFPTKGLYFLDGDTVVSPGSKDATKDAVGSIITAIDGVENKEFKNAFCCVRPPGHHAEKEKAFSFSAWCPGGLTQQKAFLNSLFSTPSIAVIIEPTASFVASLLPGETTVSPSRKYKPFVGKEF